MHATWRPPPTAAGARSCSHINDSNGNDERGIRRWSSITLCRLRDTIIRASALSRSWVVLRRASPPRYPHGPPRPSVTSEPASPPAAATAATSPSGGTAAVVMALTDLPYTIFADIVARLAPHEAVAARRTSRGLYAALTRPELCISLLLLHFPRARESRELRMMLRRGSGGDATAPLERVCWADALAATARRYHVHLGTATPRATQTLPLPRDAGGMLRGVTPWHRFLRLDDKTAAFHYWDPAWTCDADAGLLVHPVAGRRYALRDIEHGGRTWPVPFATEGRLVRRVRMSHGILVFEWCEAQEEADGAHRHFATAYDVKRVRRRGGGKDGDDDDFYTLRRYAKDGLLGGGSSEGGCAVTFRAEWKIHSLGVALRHEDRFFSTHNSTHYAVYIWQPSRSPWADDEPPLERLLVWDLGAPPPGPDPDGGPRLVAQLTNAQLDHWGVRQRGTPSLRGLLLDDRTREDDDAASTTGHVFVVEEEHRWSAGPHSSPTPPRLHHVKTTGIPLAATAGPRWVDECGKVRPDSSASRMPFCGRHGPVPGEATTWPGRCPCWRHDDFPYLTVCEVHDAGAGVRFSARHCFMLETLSVHIRPRLRIHGVAAPTPPTTTTTAGTQRRRASSTRTLETTSSSSKGGNKTTRATGRDERRRGRRADEDDAGSGVAAGSATSSDGSAATTREIQFADDAWARLLNAGYICGDERWLIGQDNDGAITIMHF